MAKIYREKDKKDNKKTNIDSSRKLRSDPLLLADSASF